jgi:hypothetical protein
MPEILCVLFGFCLGILVDIVLHHPPREKVRVVEVNKMELITQ